jgi:predicted glycoside hydrolase/deacetylase ChbG (UPF0249 family)
MEIVINVEDVGLHPAVGRAVELLADKRLVTSISVVAHGDDVENAVALQGVGIGVHLDILRGRPLCHWQEVKSLVDENGMFLVHPVKLFQRYSTGKVDHEHVQMEWRAQIERILDLGIKPTHLTSHKQVHAWPSLTRMVGELAKEYGIEWIRRPEDCREISKLDNAGDSTKFLNVCSFFDRETEGVGWTDYLLCDFDDDELLSADMFTEFLSRFKPSDDATIELSCRPGVTVAGDPPIPPYCNPPSLTAAWRHDYQSLSEDAWSDVFTSSNLTPVSYDQLTLNLKDG